MLLQSLKLTNVLSFGPDAEPVELRPLNVLIGPNGSGKSNFIEAIGLLHSAPREIVVPVREGGGVNEWIWKGSKADRVDESVPDGKDGSEEVVSIVVHRRNLRLIPPRLSGTVRDATVEAVLSFRWNRDTEKDLNLRHRVSFTEVGQRFELVDERIENEKPAIGKLKPFLYFGYERGRPMLNVTDGKGGRTLKRENLHPERSILAQFKDPEKYPELALVSEAYDDIAIYREWSFGRFSPPRMPQKADLPTDHLLENAQNLGLILNRYRTKPSTKQALIEAMRQVFEGIVDFSVKIEGGTVQVFIEEEGGWSTPATRLSDGTVRWLALLAVLLDPNPPRLICIEEPELGLHPDLIPTLARLLKEASARMQIVATTHSEILIDALSESPEDVLVCERESGSTTMHRLDRESLAEWLGEYRLGQLWSKGVLGGNRW